MADIDQHAEARSTPPEVESSRPANFAWQPLTPSGIASFASANYGRLNTVCLLVAALVAVLTCWFAHWTVLPFLQSAAKQLPETGAILNRELTFSDPVRPVLVEERILGIVVDLDGQEYPSLSSDFQIILQSRHVKICSLLGCVGLDYPGGWMIEVNRTAWLSAIEAWKPMVLAILFLGVVVYLLICWHILATLYSPFVWAASYYSDRRLSLGGSWRLAYASLMPSALLMGFTLLLYGLGWISLVRFAVISVLHMLVPWLFGYFIIKALPRVQGEAASIENPFEPPKVLTEDSPQLSQPPDKPNKNPFMQGSTSPPSHDRHGQ